MPAPIIYQKGQGLAQGISHLGSALSSAVEDYAKNQEIKRKEQAQKQNLTDLGSILSNESLDLTTPEGIKQFFSQAASRNIKIDPIEMVKLSQTAQANQLKKTPLSDVQKAELKDNQKWVTEQKNKGFQAGTFLQRLPELEQAISSPELTNQWDITRYSKQLLSATPLGEKIYNTPEQTLASFNKEMVTALSDLKNIRLTDSKLRWISGAVPAPGKSVEANKEAFRIQKDILTLQSQVPKLIDLIIEENNGVIPNDIRQQVNDRLADTIASYVENQPDFKENTNKASSNQIETTPNNMNSFPPAKGNQGRKVKNNETGVTYISDGKKWTKI